MHQREVLAPGGGTLSDTMHVVLGSATVLLMFGALTFWDAPRVQANPPTPWIGLWERINISGFLLWVVVLATVLLRGGSGRSGQPGAMKAAARNRVTR